MEARLGRSLISSDCRDGDVVRADEAEAAGGRQTLQGTYPALFAASGEAKVTRFAELILLAHRQDVL